MEPDSLAQFGEFNLLTAQGAVVEPRTVTNRVLLRISRKRLQHLIRASSGVVLIGQPDGGETSRLQRFLVRNSYPHRIVGPSTANHEPRIGDLANLPAVVLSDTRTTSRPTISEIADELAITESPDPETVYDVAVVGAGPAGLAAAVCAASESLRIIVIERLAPGGTVRRSKTILASRPGSADSSWQVVPVCRL